MIKPQSSGRRSENGESPRSCRAGRSGSGRSRWSRSDVFVSRCTRQLVFSQIGLVEISQLTDGRGGPVVRISVCRWIFDMAARPTMVCPRTAGRSRRCRRASPPAWNVHRLLLLSRTTNGRPDRVSIRFVGRIALGIAREILRGIGRRSTPASHAASSGQQKTGFIKPFAGTAALSVGGSLFQQRGVGTSCGLFALPLQALSVPGDPA